MTAMSAAANPPSSSACAPTPSMPNNAMPTLLPATALRTLWLRMGEIYGHRWTSAYGESADTGAGGTWSKGLAGLSPSQLAAGLSASIASADAWPPTLPEFRARCIGIPSFTAMRFEFRDIGGWKWRPPSAFARLMYRFLEHGRFREGDRKTADKALQEAYELASDHLLRGGSLPPEPVAAIAHLPVKAPELSEEEKAENAARARASADRAFAEIRETLGVQDGSEGEAH